MPSFMGRRVNRQYSPHGYTTPKPKHSTVPSSELPKPRIKIGEDMAATKQGPVSNTRAARKANSPKAKAKALKSVNKNPMTPAGDGDGFIPSQAANDYTMAHNAESRLKDSELNNNSSSYVDQKATTHRGNAIRPLRERDEDRVGAYIATGESPYGPKGEEWVAKEGFEARQKKYG